VRRISIALLTAILWTGCSPRPIFDRHWPDAYWRSGDYVLLAIDTEAQMSLNADVKDVGKAFIVNVVDATVFSVGANDRYIVAKQHPLVGESQTTFDSRITNYFVIDRGRVPTLREPQKGVTGPLTKEAFDRLAETTGLPRFTKTFRKLEWRRTD
jgi:hypothetical protein